MPVPAPLSPAISANFMAFNMATLGLCDVLNEVRNEFDSSFTLVTRANNQGNDFDGAQRWDQVYKNIGAEVLLTYTPVKANRAMGYRIKEVGFEVCLVTPTKLGLRFIARGFDKNEEADMGDGFTRLLHDKDWAKRPEIQKHVLTRAKELGVLAKK